MDEADRPEPMTGTILKIGSQFLTFL